MVSEEYLIVTSILLEKELCPLSHEYSWNKFWGHTIPQYGPIRSPVSVRNISYACFGRGICMILVFEQVV